MRDLQESTDVFCVLSARASSADSKCMGRATLRGRPGNHGQAGQSVESVQEIPDSQDEPVPMQSLHMYLNFLTESPSDVIVRAAESVEIQSTPTPAPTKAPTPAY